MGKAPPDEALAAPSGQSAHYRLPVPVSGLGKWVSLCSVLRKLGFLKS